MKKNLFFLIILCAVILSCGINVHALETTKFYESDYVDMYIKRHYSYDINTPHYNQSRVYREQGTNQESFCVQPDAGTNPNAIAYKEIPFYLTDQQIERIKLLSYFGYKYPEHNTNKWYTITQVLIWKTVDPLGLYYFTDSLNGNPTSIYDNEINQLNALVDNYLTKPNISIPKVIKSNRKIELIDTNNVLSYYKTNIGTISGNKLIIDNLEEGEHTIKLSRTFEKIGKEPAFYTSDNSQNMYIPGDIDDIYINLKIKAINTSLKIIKKDKDNKYYKSTSLEGTTFKLINISTKEEKELIIDKNNRAYIEDLDFGNYMLIETTPGKGYKLSKEEIPITIDENNPHIEIDIENEVIKKEIIIHKTYGEYDFYNEANITFEVYDENNNLFGTYTTDESGYIRLTLPYGKYTLKQVNTTDGYQKIEPLEIIVENEDILFIELKDYKIKVPNTYHKISIFSIILKFILLVL